MKQSKYSIKQNTLHGRLLQVLFTKYNKFKMISFIV